MGFQTNMLEMLKQTGRSEMVVGWYHSHPGFGCWLSGVDVNTQKSFEALNERAVAVVVDPRQTTSNVGHLHKPSIQALVHGLNRSYYSIAISYRKNELEMDMLANLHKRRWLEGLSVVDFEKHSEANLETVERMVSLATKYNKDVQAEEGLSAEELAIAHVGKVDAKRHLDQAVDDLMAANIVQSLGTMLDSVVF